MMIESSEEKENIKIAIVKTNHALDRHVSDGPRWFYGWNVL